EWVNSPRGWRSLFEYRRGSSSELQKELQIRLRLQPETLALATESLAYSWTVIAALRNFGLSSLFGPGGRGDSSSASRRRPLRVLLLGAGERTSFCPRALFRDLAALVPGDEPQNNNSNNNNQVHVILAGFEDAQGNNNNNNRGHHFQATEPEEVEALRCFRVPEDGRLSVERLTWKDLQKRWWAKPVAEASHNNHNNDNNIDRDAAPDIAVVVGLPEHMWSRVLPSLLQNGLPTVVTASNQGTLETGLQRATNSCGEPSAKTSGADVRRARTKGTGGNTMMESPTAADIKQILEAGGISCDDELLGKLIEKMDGKQAHELIAAGYGKFAACGGGGGGGGAAAPAAASGGGGGAAAAKEEKKIVEEEEEEDVDFDLFG
ncbi:unnamed protein product, partial [Polarella glacialis]